MDKNIGLWEKGDKLNVELMDLGIKIQQMTWISEANPKMMSDKMDKVGDLYKQIWSDPVRQRAAHVERDHRESHQVKG